MPSAIKQTPIRHDEGPWAVEQRIALAPPEMQTREFMQNAIEAAQLTEGDQQAAIRWYATDYPLPNGKTVQKLSVWNTGPGMDGTELQRVMNLGATGGAKLNDVQHNFGVGAKVAGLRANPYGLRYRSCYRGRVRQIIIAKGADGYCIERQKKNGRYYETIDVTEQCVEQGHQTEHDWTEVTLLGQSVAHNTVLCPYDPDVELPGNWLMQAINRRFYSIPEYINASIDKSIGPSDDQRRRVRGLSYATSHMAEREETVESHDLSIRYVLLKQRRGGGYSGRLGFAAHICLVWKDECYDLHASTDWARVAYRYGVQYGAARVTIQIHLPDDYPVIPEQYRRHIDSQASHEPVFCEHFEERVLDGRPQWLLEFIASQRPQNDEISDNLRDRLRHLLAEYNWLRHIFQLSDEGDKLTGEPNRLGEGPSEKSGGSGSRSDNTNGDHPAIDADEVPSELPKVEWTSGGTKTTEGVLSQRLGRYLRKQHTIELNRDYELIEHLVERACTEFVHVRDQEMFRKAATAHIKEELHYQAVKHVMLALAWSGEPFWSENDIQSTLKEQVLTVSISDHVELYRSVNRRLVRKFRRNGKAAEAV